MCQQDSRSRAIYYNGLCYVISEIAKENSYSSVLLSLWGQSILGFKPDSTNGSLDDAKKALSLHRKGLHFFRNKYEFLFDAFYLAETLSQQLLDSLYDILKDQVCGAFTKGALNQVSDYFKFNRECTGIPAPLILHRLTNKEFIERGVKRVLVCGNIASGKTSVINALIGKRFLKTSNIPSEKESLTIFNSREKENVYLNNGKQYMFVPSDDADSIDTSFFNNVGISFSSGLGNNAVALIDCRGFNSDAGDNARGCGRLIEVGYYNLVIYVSNCQYFGTTDEYDILSFLYSHCKKPIIFVLNKLDQFKSKDDSIAKMISDFRRNLTEIGFSRPTIIPLSSHAALLFRIEESDEEDMDDKAILSDKFAKTYYDLPQYVLNKASSSLEEKSGILLLEKSIKEKLSI